MVIRGTVHNGQIEFNSSLLAEGTQVIITPIQSTNIQDVPKPDLDGFKAEIQRIASLESESNYDDGFTGADHDKILYGN